MTSRRSQFLKEAPPGGYFPEPTYVYTVHPPQTQDPFRNVPARMAEDYSQMYPPSSAATNIFVPGCCRSRRRASRYSKTYESEGSTKSYASYEDVQPAQPVDRLPPRIALKQLSDFLHEAGVFYNTQLMDFAREHQRQGHDTSNEALRQWLWNDWIRSRDNPTRENFTSTKTSITLLLRQVESAIATPWLENADLNVRFDFSYKVLKSSCDEIVRLSGKLMSDWQTCRFLAVELKNARVYADPEGPVLRHLFVGWEKGEPW
ncbi:hypothetical protein FPCIR_7531 [Fusarium pseudocircinatum]|uniref:Uncharacterized protein n=1 Tax=Fusarium pseudocircinatum TaxID=56676 RepID=A0A8H5LAD4_9HYPO|nr:hypothetical protein FPCIR_7531 [Fusarium pseudocircinatum]